MKTVEYKLKSILEEVVRVPEAYSKRNEDLVKYSTENTKESLDSALSLFFENPELDENLVFSTFMSLIHTKETATPISLKLQDELYLRACLCYAKGKNKRNIINTIEKL